MAAVRKADIWAAKEAERKALKERMAKKAREINALAGIVGEPDVTAEELQELMRADGVNPEDNGASRELMRIRYGDDWN